MIAQYFSRNARATFLAAALLTIAPIAAQAASVTLQGQDRDTAGANGSLPVGFGVGNGTWTTSSLQNWREQDLIPLRLVFTGNAVNQTVTVQIDHNTVSGTPGFVGLFPFTATYPPPSAALNSIFTSPDGVIITNVTLDSSAPTWTYTFTANFVGATGTVQLKDWLAAGAHNFTGNSLQLKGSGGTLGVFKPGATPGNPDLVLTKTGPATAAPGQTITYTLSYQNVSTLAGGSSATGTSLTDTLPAGLTYVPGSGSCTGTCAGTPTLNGNQLIWALGAIAPTVSGSQTFQATVSAIANNGDTLMNSATVLSAENDVTPANNTSNLTTTVSITATNLAVDAASGTYGTTASLSATLTLGGAVATPIIGQTITFKLNGTAVCGGATGVTCPTTNASGVATLNTSILGIDVGAYLTGVRADFAAVTGPPKYDATGNNGKLTVTTKTASVSAVVNSKTYGDPDPSLATTTSGFLAGDLGALKITFSASRASGETVAGGPYLITPTASDNSTGLLTNYDITYNTANFTIDKVLAAVSAVANSKTYGGSEPTLATTNSGFLSGDLDALKISFSASRANGETVAGGPYLITPAASDNSTGLLSNYDVSYNAANFTINKALASVSAVANSKTYGGADPALATTNSGFLIGDVDALKISFSASRANGETVAGGPYLITPTASDNSTGLLTNYDVTVNTATFAINRILASVSAVANSKTYGDSDPALGTTHSGFLAGDLGAPKISFSASRAGGETVAGGPYVITPTASDNSTGLLANYDVTFNTASFTIDKILATVSAVVNSKTYGDSDPTLATTHTGFLVGDLGALKISFTASRANGDTVAGSTYLITPTASDNSTGLLTNYDVTYNTANFTIDKALASVSAVANSKAYGATEPTLTTTNSGFLAGDLGALKISFSASRANGESVAGGPYLITPAAGDNSTNLLTNYDVTYNTANFTIDKALASVSAVANSKTYGDSDPTLATTHAGFVAGDLGPLKISFSALRASGETVAGGPYLITPAASDNSTSLLTNYDVTLNTGNFTVTKKTASVTVGPKTKAYGKSDPALTGTLTGFLSGDGVTATYSRTAGETVAGSPYTISATLSPTGVLANYDITNDSAQFTITRADISGNITATGGTFVFSGISHPGGGSAAGAKGEVLPVTLTYAGVSPTIYPATASAPTAVGTYKVTASTVGDANNLAASSAPVALTITKASSTTTVTASDTTYDGLPHGAIGHVAGVAGLAQAVTPITYSGRNGTAYNSTTPPTNAGDYTGSATFTGDANHSSSSGSRDFSIDKATLHTGAGGTIVINHYDVTYNGAPHTATGSVKGLKGENLTNLLTLTGSSHTSIGNYAADPWTFGGNANYNSANGVVTPADKIGGKTITVTAAGVDKVYDGTTTANVTLLTNKVGSDQVTASFTGATFADKHVGAAKPVNVTGVSISGADASNYTLANTTASTTASITAKPITVTAVPDTKLYDGTTTSTGIPKVSAAAVAGDKSNFIQTFDSKVVGGKRKLTPSGSVTDGNTGKNYAVTFVAITVPGGGVITARTVTGGITAASKTYDGTKRATIAARTLTGALSSDAVTLSGGTATFADPNAGTGKTVTATGLSLSGADADNYDLSSATATAKADITKANQVINFAPIENKIFNVDGPFKIDATASSGLPVTFALTAGPAKLDGAEVTITGVGKITITAMQAGDSNYNPAETVQKFFAAVPPPALLNISTRGRVGTQDNVLIGGYIVKGVEEKKFAARAIGPSLKTKDTSQVVVDPLLELHGPDGALLAKNDNFAETQLPEIQAAQLVPTNALESVLIKGAMPGNYTAIVKDKREANGIGLVELYDLSQNSNSSLANISTRGVVGTGPDVLIGGFIVNGKVGAAKVILRAIGPSLAEAGIANALPNPTMELHDHNGVLIGSDDDWQDDATQAALIQGTGIPPKNALESAFVTSLAPGNYTVIVADKDGKTGVGLVEVYDLTY
jgi:uncharacterized repeat protein (TIGR01451 family)